MSPYHKGRRRENPPPVVGVMLIIAMIEIVAVAIIVGAVIWL